MDDTLTMREKGVLGVQGAISHSPRTVHPTIYCVTTVTPEAPAFDMTELNFDLEGDHPEIKISVLLPLPLAGAFTYRASTTLGLSPGDFVTVPLGRRDITGVVWDEPAAFKDGSDLPDCKVKSVVARHNLPRLTEAHRRFVDWVSDYTLSPPGAVLRLGLGVSKLLEPFPPIVAYSRAKEIPANFRATSARTRVLSLLEDSPPRLAKDISREAGVGVSVIRAMVTAGLLDPVELPPETPPRPDPDCPGPDLTEVQRAAADAIVSGLAAGFSVTLIDGVTGSGKTEVYLEAVAAAVRSGTQVLVLVPEIALSAPWLERFRRRFGASPIVWHSDLTGAARKRAWHNVAYGEASVIVGARSALFLPFRKLGLIVIDEEHDTAFKQEDGVAYNARDMAVVRAQLEGAPAVLASATPSLETLANVESGRYRCQVLSDRFGGAGLPKIEIADLRQAGKNQPGSSGNRRWIAAPLARAISATLEREEQVLLYLNRRGYAPLTLCGACGHRMQCPNCTAWLVEHRLASRLMCHHCGLATPRPSVCPECETEDTLVACGPGVERIAEEVLDRWPEARFAAITSDTVHGPGAAAELVRSIVEREVDVVIGTQMVAKGHHFPHLTLVGVIDADLGLVGGDLRAAERTYQILHQVAGRAGREERPGRAILQTMQPSHPVIEALAGGDRDRFIAIEMEERRVHGMPPFGRLAGVILSAPDPDQVDHAAATLRRAVPAMNGVTVLGPAPAPLEMLRGRHRRRFLVRGGRGLRLQPFLRDWLSRVKLPSAIRVQVDIDPQSFL